MKPNKTARLILEHWTTKAILDVDEFLFAGIREGRELQDFILGAAAYRSLGISLYTSFGCVIFPELAGMTPIKIQHAIQDLEPIKVSYSHRRSQTESMFQLIAVTVTALTAYMRPGQISAHVLMLG